MKNRNLFLLTSGLAFPLLGAYAQKTPKPNIIYIMCDDMGYGDLGCYGQPYISTPNIDNMAKEGMRFTQAYAGSPVSAPSRASFMTGQHSGHCEVRGNKEYWRDAPVVMYGNNKEYAVVGQHPYDPGHVIIPEIMKDNGYTTGMFGKWAGGYEGSVSTPDKRGIDEYYGYIKGYPRYDISFDYFRRASYKNHPGSFYMMAKLYINGFVGSKSNDELKEAFKYLNTAIEYGNVAAINAMGLLYLNGTYPVKKDINTAIEFFEKASSKDYPYAYNNLGLIYEAKGDMKKAFEFFEKSSLLDESWALNKIGEFYRNGIYVKKDMKKAFDYYNKAIEAPISTVSYYAFYNLAKYYYLTGNTVLIKDEDKAIKYLDIASSHAIEAAILLLYLYTEKYLNKKDDDLYDKIKLFISRIENNPKYNESIKSIIEDNLKKLKENKHINIDILN